MKSFIISAILFFTWNIVNASPADPTVKEIKRTINAFVQAGEHQDVQAYAELLHPEFRVIANRYPAADKTTLLDAKTYLSLIEKKAIGGASYTVSFMSVNLSDHSATAIVELHGKQRSQLVTFLLIKDEADQWRIISDMVVQIEQQQHE